MSLEIEIAQSRNEIKTDGYDMSIGELMNLYRDRELLLKPKYQRFFRWDIEQKSKFIESILLGIPIPSIFVAQRGSGVWETVDGLQRLSTLFELAGILRDRNENPIPPLVLRGTRYLPSLEGKTWGHEDRDDPNTLTAGQRIDVKRSKLSVKIVLKESERFTKFELFQRLNTGGSLASEQEVRNCMLVDTNEVFFDWLERLSSDENFIACTRLSERQVDEQYHMEIATRFVVLRTVVEANLTGLGHIGDYLDTEILKLAERRDFDAAGEEAAFRETFAILARTTGGDSFRKWDAGSARFRGGFLISAFEAVALGIGFNIDRIRRAQNFEVESRIREVWNDAQFLEWTGVGRSAGARLPRSIPTGRRIFRP